jgi:alanyl-tRNA synthetase
MKAAEILRTQPEHLAKATKELLDRWKVAEKELSKARTQVAGSRLAEFKLDAVLVREDVKMISEIVENVGVNELIEMADTLIRDDKAMAVALVTPAAPNAHMVMMAGNEAVQAGVNCGEIVAASSMVLGGKGGGRPEFGQGGGPYIDKLKEALEKARELVGSAKSK